METSEEIKPSKDFYIDENELIDDFCSQMKCSGIETVGESGGESCYGCDELEDFQEKYIDSHAEDYHERVRTKITELEQENKKLKEAIDRAPCEYKEACLEGAEEWEDKAKMAHRKTTELEQKLERCRNYLNCDDTECASLVRSLIKKEGTCPCDKWQLKKEMGW